MELQMNMQDYTQDGDQELAEHGNRYKQITVAITNYIYTAKVENGRSVKIVHNADCVEVTGYTQEELSDSPALWLDIIPREDHPIVLDQIERIFANEEAGTIEHRIVNKDGTLRWISNTPILHYNAAGVLSSYNCIVRDVTVRKMAEIELQKAHDKLELRVEERNFELNKANKQLRNEIEERKQLEEALIKSKTATERATKVKSEFLANMSHEIRTPMNAVLGMTKLALHCDLPEKVEKYLKIVESSGNILLGVINDILDFSKIESGNLSLEKINFNLHDILFNLEAMFLEKIEETGNQFTISTHPNVPDAIIGDPLRLGQILVNLVSNAMKFTSNGEVAVDITYKDISVEEVEIQISVNDTGIGIETDRIEEIFTPYTQADNSIARKFGGTGLGLTISLELIKMLGGDLKVRSVVNEGSNFTFTIPMGVQPVESTIDISNNLQGKRILIVDDDPMILSCLKESLVLSGFDVETADGPFSGLKKLHEDMQFDLLLMDMVMPEQDGLTTAKAIQNDPLIADIPIIILTGYGSSLVQQMAESACVDAILHKPVNLNILLENINQVLVVKDKDDATISEKKASVSELLCGVRVLVVEDNQFNQLLAREVLENAGLSVRLADNGRQAIEMLDMDIDVVLMDLQMPEMDGLEATKLIRQQQQFEDVPIIAMTAHAMSGYREKCIEAGMNDYVSKPFQPEEIFTVLARSIGVRKNNRRRLSAGGRGKPCDKTRAIDLACVGRYLQETYKISSAQIEMMLQSAKRSLAEGFATGGEALAKGDLDSVSSMACRMGVVLRKLGLEKLVLLAERIQKQQVRKDDEKLPALQEQFEFLKHNLSSFVDEAYEN